jgi:hypothetical protein
MSWTILPPDRRPPAALMQVQHLSVLHDSIAKDIRWAKEKMKRYYDLKRGDTPHLKRGERVYLLRRTIGRKDFNIKSKRPSNKLDAVKYGPFKIEKKLANNNYRLTLPTRMRVYLVFHISLLEPTLNPENTKDEATDINKEFEVEKILDQRTMKGQVQYLVRWKGYSPENNSWEPVRHLNCPNKIREFQHEDSRRKGPTKKAMRRPQQLPH